MSHATTCTKCGKLYDESSEEEANSPNRTCGDCHRLTLFICGPSKCEHDYSRFEDISQDGRVAGGTAVCAKCGAAAIDEAMWL